MQAEAEVAAEMAASVKAERATAKYQQDEAQDARKALLDKVVERRVRLSLCSLLAFRRHDASLAHAACCVTPPCTAAPGLICTAWCLQWHHARLNSIQMYVAFE
jgi:hypothetical protein